MRNARGFTLIEVAIVMVIVGMLLGGILKGQELMNAARVRSFAAQLDGVKIAYLGFMDRYGALPGDMATAAANLAIPGNAGGCTGGTGCGNGVIDPDENFVVWAQLSHAGFIIGRYNGTIADTVAVPANSPRNPFGGYLHVVTDSDYDDVLDPAQPVVLNIKTGGRVPVAVLAELDRKTDDGAPLTGTFRSSGYVAGTAYDGVANCNVAGAPVQWNAGSDLGNCGGAVIQ